MNRSIAKVFTGVATSDGDGVKLTRIIGSQQLDMLDPFLLLDRFESDDVSDYIGGFPTHPHRGFETVTYMLHGKMRHKDSAGNEGVIVPGGVQWMTAGKGVLHSEMPEQDEGLLKGFQLWVNLPKEAKMVEPDYQEFPASSTPFEQRPDGTTIRVIAGETELATKGVVNNSYIDPTYFDVTLPVGKRLSQPIPQGHNAFIYMIEGSVNVVGGTGEDHFIEESRPQQVISKQLAILGEGDQLVVEATSGINSAEQSGARFLLLAGKPLNEPVVRAGRL